MASLLLYFGYRACYVTRDYECSSTRLPDISHVMGHPPLNKLYAMMLTFYAMVKQEYVRAYNHRLQGICPKFLQMTLLVYACISCICGPAIGYYDVFYDVDKHCTAAALFTLGEILYMFTMVGILNTHREHFPGYDFTISSLVAMAVMAGLLGVWKLGEDIFDYDIGVWGSIIEWVEFLLSFLMFAVVAHVMPYNQVLTTI